MQNCNSSDIKIIKGGYLLLIGLRKDSSLPKRFNSKIKPGLYAYAGNANGFGGVRARCKRHFKIKKKRIWHVDWLTAQSKEIKALFFPDKNECDIVNEILKIKDTVIPQKGFGSTDCKACVSHLIKLPTYFSKKLFKISYIYIGKK